jgi:hypothetical protein
MTARLAALALGALRVARERRALGWPDRRALPRPASIGRRAADGAPPSVLARAPAPRRFPELICGEPCPCRAHAAAQAPR